MWNRVNRCSVRKHWHASSAAKKRNAAGSRRCNASGFWDPDRASLSPGNRQRKKTQPRTESAKNRTGSAFGKIRD